MKRIHPILRQNAAFANTFFCNILPSEVARFGPADKNRPESLKEQACTPCRRMRPMRLAGRDFDYPTVEWDGIIS